MRAVKVAGGAFAGGEPARTASPEVTTSSRLWGPRRCGTATADEVAMGRIDRVC
ncbi:MAG: hypothetical protein P4L86_06520 [Mycobacterium sp.]|nr:hypothetical protein [Mycobacterium sp.]